MRLILAEKIDGQTMGSNELSSPTKRWILNVLSHLVWIVKKNAQKEIDSLAVWASVYQHTHSMCSPAMSSIGCANLWHKSNVPTSEHHRNKHEKNTHTQTSYRRVSISHCKKHRTNWCKSILKRTAGHRYTVGVWPFLKSTPGISAIIGLHRQKSNKAWNQAHTCHTHTAREREGVWRTLHICTNMGHIVQRHRKSRENQQETKLSLVYITNEFDWFRTIYPFVCDWNHIQGTKSFNMFRKNAHERDARRILMKNYATDAEHWKEEEEKIEPKNTWLFIFSLMTDRFVKWENTQDFSSGPQFKPMSIVDFRSSIEFNAPLSH